MKCRRIDCINAQRAKNYECRFAKECEYFVQADDVSDTASHSSPVAGLVCDVCGFKFPSHEGLPELIAEMLNEITTCSECTARQLDERIGDIKDGVR